MGRSKRPGVTVEAEMEDGYAALGFASTMTKEINTDIYLKDVLELAYAAMNNEFESVVAAAAATNPNKYRHVYEPGKVGIPQFKLWEMKFYGRGAKREVSWEWKMSVLPILTPEERAFDSTDAMSKLKDDPELLEDLSENRYVFRMQAPIMEAGIRVNIAATNAKALFIPTWKKNKDKKGRVRNYRFEKYNVPDWSYRNPQDPSGKGGNTVGQFTALWVTYWNGGGAESVWDTRIAPAIEKGLVNGAQDELKKMSRKRRNTVAFTTFKDAYAAQESGANLARAFISGKARSYRQAAKHIDKYGAFGGDTVY